MAQPTHSYLLYLHQQTPRAFLVSTDQYGDRKHNYSAFWLPASQVTEVSRRRSLREGEQILLEIPQWLAERHRLDPTLDGEDDSLIEPT